MGNAAASCDLPILGCQDGGDPSALPPRPTGNYITTSIHCDKPFPDTNFLEFISRIGNSNNESSIVH